MVRSYRLLSGQQLDLDCSLEEAPAKLGEILELTAERLRLCELGNGEVQAWNTLEKPLLMAFRHDFH